MKSFFCILFITYNSLLISAQVFEVEDIKVSGAKDTRINLVFMGDGYTSLELDKFITDATNFSNSLFSQSPFLEYTDYFNTYAIKVISNESGTDHPGTATDVTEPHNIPVKSVDTYFSTSFDVGGFHRLLYTYDSATIYNVLADNLPEFDQPIIIVNSSEYGGAGGPYATSSTGLDANEIVIHEIGHSLFDLKDEYFDSSIIFQEKINMTQESDPSLVKWKNWVGTNNVGIYPYGASGIEATWNRPHQRCKMRYLGDPFCSVCKEGIIEKIHSLVSPIDNYTPDNTVDDPTFPLEFKLDLIKPNPNTLESEWTLNATTFANNVDDISVLESDLIEGTNTLTTVVNDNSPFLRVDNHDSFHVYTVTWTINFSLLGIDDIEDKLNNFNISLYPNPANTILNLKFESNTSSDLKAEIISLDGKKIKSFSLSNYENTEIDISQLSQGIYLTNFYSGNVLIASKRLVKN